jgi:hypothetical protein
MRLIAVALALVGCVGCAERPPLSVRAVGEGYACTVAVNGAAVSTDDQLRALARTTGKKALVETDRNTPYRCVGATIIRLQEVGFKVLAVTADGVSIMSR